MASLHDLATGAAVKVHTDGSLDVNVVSGGAGGGAATIADGADVAQGATTDAALTADGTGTLSSKLRGLVKIFADIWDSANHRINVAVQNFPSTYDISDRSARLVGHVTVDSAPNVAGTVTANAGTNLNTSALALESGGNLAAIKADTDRIPAQGAAATVASLPVNIASDQTVPVTGTVTANAGTNTSTAALALENGGKLATTADAAQNLVLILRELQKIRFVLEVGFNADADLIDDLDTLELV